MASSMCGPSNALSSLQKHTSVDRTLQQDRLHSPSSSSQLFRTPTTRPNQQLEAEFSQFSTGPVLQDPRQYHPASPLHQQAPPLSGWAADFQRLHISQSPAPQLLQNHHHQQQQSFGQSWASANWHEEFLQQSPSPQTMLRGASMGAGGVYSPSFSPGMQMGAGGGMYMGGLQQQQNASEQQFSDAAFEQAFEDARAQLQEQHDREALSSAVQETVVAPEPVEKEQETVKDKEHDSDELAKTAAQLLDSLSGERSRKFQDSTFLALMRKLRDREVVVEGDRMVEQRMDEGVGGGNANVAGGV